MEMRMALTRILVLGCLICLVDGAEILVTCLVGSISHHLALHPLAVGLADKGHQVTYLGSLIYPDQDSRIRYVSSNVHVDAMKIALSQVGDPADRFAHAPNPLKALHPLVTELCRVFYSDPIIHEWIRTSAFDLLITDGVFSECALGLAYKFNSPFIFFTTAAFLPWHADMVGLPMESSWLPDLTLNYTQQMGFLERVYNTYTTLEMHLYHMSFNYYSDIIGVLRKGLQDPDVPEVSDFFQNVSLIFINSYFASEYARSLPPFVIPIGGIHCSMPKKNMSTELVTFISKTAEDGFVFISFGTAFKPSQISLHDMFEAMKKFPKVGFIFRWHGKFPDERADNVLFVSWAPQQTLLAHPKIRAFVSHCGMSSTQEIIHYGVPVLAIPGFADQDYNAECLMRLGAGRRLELTDFDEAAFEEALRDVLTNPAYKTRVRMLRNLYHDRPQSPLETAVWWSEYVLRHSKVGGDLSIMKPLGINQYWWQRRLVDVYLFIFIIMILTIGTLVAPIVLIFLKLLLILKPSNQKVSKKIN